MPDDFLIVAPTLTKCGVDRHYRTTRPTRDRWLREAPEVILRGRNLRALRSTGRASSRLKDDLYREIDRLIPLGFADDVRSDAISEIYLSVLDGSLPRDRLAEKGRAIVNRVADFCGLGSRSPVSLDNMLSEDGSSFLDMVEDEGALAAFDNIFDPEE